MAKTILYVLGAVLTVVGIIGFVNDPVLGVFEVDTLHNFVHLVSGVIFLGVAAFASAQVQMTAKTFGIIYAVIAVLGFTIPGDTILGLVEGNLADHVLHAALALALLYGGFMGEKGMGSGSGGL